MKVDIYGSRSLMMTMVDIRNDINIEISDAFIGTNLASQSCVEVPINHNRMKRITSEYESIEIRTDLLKRFRKFKDFKESNIIIIDFTHEGKELIDVHNGTVVDRPVLKRYGYDTTKAKITEIDRINHLEENIEDLLSYIAKYKIVILVKMRNPKFKESINGEKLFKDDFHEINQLNNFAEMCEDLLINKLPNLYIVDSFKELEELRDGYQRTSGFNDYLASELKIILKKSNNYI